jgi:hypothetical protein
MSQVRILGRMPSIVTIAALLIVLSLTDVDSSQTTKAKGKAAAKSPSDLDEEFAKYTAPLSGERSPIATGKRVTVSLSSGKMLADFDVTEVLLGKGDETLKFLSLQDADGKKKQKLTSSAIARIRSGDHNYDVQFDPTKKGHVLLDVTQRDLDINERLKESGNRLWDETSDEDRAKTIAEYKKFLQTVQASYQFPTKIYETKFFLVLSDIPPAQVAPYVSSLDAMYAKLSAAFGVPKDKNIWLGKCLVLAFLNEESFHAFERTFMKNTDTQGSQGLHHSASDGRAVISCYRGDNPSYFAIVLVHETAHGFLHRLRSSVHIPPWINEGIADWVAGAIVTQSKAVVERQKEGVALLRQTGSLGVNFFDERANLQPWQYGIASNLTNFMLQIDAGRYRVFILAIKEGFTPEDALKRAYGLTPEELIGQYGRSIGLNGLRP